MENHLAMSPAERALHLARELERTYRRIKRALKNGNPKEAMIALSTIWMAPDALRGALEYLTQPEYLRRTP